jgi:hypothetical protein
MKGSEPDMKAKRCHTFRKTQLVLIFMLFGTTLPARTWADPVLKPRFFAEVYNETISLGREERNVITMTQALQGARAHIAGVSTIDVYLKQRFGGDVNRDYWNNRGELMLGARARFFKKIYLSLFAEYIRGTYFDLENPHYRNPYEPNYVDLRYGLIFWQGWDRAWSVPETGRVPLSFWEEIYSELIHFRRDRDNTILFLKTKAGLRMLRIHKTTAGLYGVHHLNLDTNGDFWNNRSELGLGTRVKPWTDVGLSLFAEYLIGTYLDRQGRYVNPYPKAYGELRIGLVFWYGREF